MSEQGSSGEAPGGAAAEAVAARARPRQSRDKGLVEAARAGDNSAFGKLYDAWVDNVYDRAVNGGASAAEAREITEQTFLTAHRDMESLRQPGAIGAKIMQVTRRETAARVKGAPKPATPVPGKGATAEERLSRATNATAAASDPEIAAVLRQAALALDDQTREILDLHFRQGLTKNETAAVLGEEPDRVTETIAKLPPAMAALTRARVLWRGGQPEDDLLADELRSNNVKEFNAQAVRVINRFAKDNDRARARSLIGIPPVELYAAIPLADAPAGLKMAVASTLVTEGVPMDGSAFVKRDDKGEILDQPKRVSKTRDVGADRPYGDADARSVRPGIDDARPTIDKKKAAAVASAAVAAELASDKSAASAASAVADAADKPLSRKDRKAKAEQEKAAAEKAQADKLAADKTAADKAAADKAAADKAAAASAASATPSTDEASSDEASTDGGGDTETLPGRKGAAAKGAVAGAVAAVAAGAVAGEAAAEVTGTAEGAKTVAEADEPVEAKTGDGEQADTAAGESTTSDAQPADSVSADAPATDAPATDAGSSPTAGDTKAKARAAAPAAATAAATGAGAASVTTRMDPSDLPPSRPAPGQGSGPDGDRASSPVKWIAAAIVVLLLLGGGAFALTRGGDKGGSVNAGPATTATTRSATSTIKVGDTTTTASPTGPTSATSSTAVTTSTSATSTTASVTPTGPTSTTPPTTAGTTTTTNQYSTLTASIGLSDTTIKDGYLMVNAPKLTWTSNGIGSYTVQVSYRVPGGADVPLSTLATNTTGLPVCPGTEGTDSQGRPNCTATTLGEVQFRIVIHTSDGSGDYLQARGLTITA